MPGVKRVVVVLCALGVLCGCGGSGEEQPRALPPVTATGSVAPPGSGPSSIPPPPSRVPAAGASSAPLPSPITPASAATRADEVAEAASAEQFAKNYVEALNRAYRSLDVTELVALTDSSCVSCQNQIVSLRHAAAAGEHYRGGQIAIKSAAAPTLENGETIVLADVSVPELQVLNRDEVVTETVPPFRNATLNITVRRVTGRWIVMETTRG